MGDEFREATDPLEEEEFQLEARLARLLHIAAPVRKSKVVPEDPYAGWPEKDPLAQEWGQRWLDQDPLDRIPLPYDWDPTEETCVCNKDSVVLWVFGEKYYRYTDKAVLLKDEQDRRDALMCQEHYGWQRICFLDSFQTGFPRLLLHQKLSRDDIRAEQQLLFAEMKSRSDVVFAEGLLRHPGFLLRSINAARAWPLETRAREDEEQQEYVARSRLELIGIKLARSVAEGQSVSDLEGGWKQETPPPTPPLPLLGGADKAGHRRWKFSESDIDSGAAVAQLYGECDQLRAAKGRVDKCVMSLLALATSEAVVHLLQSTPRLGQVIASGQLAEELTKAHSARVMRSRWRKGGGPPYLLLAELPRTALSAAHAYGIAEFVRAREADPAAEQPFEVGVTDQLHKALESAAGDQLAGLALGDSASVLQEGALAPLWCLVAADRRQRDKTSSVLGELAARCAACPEEGAVAALTQEIAALTLTDIIVAKATAGGFLRRLVAVRAKEAGGKWGELLKAIAAAESLGAVLALVEATVGWIRGKGDDAESMVLGAGIALALQAELPPAVPGGPPRVVADSPAALLVAALWLACTEPPAEPKFTGGVCSIVSAAARGCEVFGPALAQRVVPMAGLFIGALREPGEVAQEMELVVGFAGARPQAHPTSVPLLSASEVAGACSKRLELLHTCLCARLHDLLPGVPHPLQAAARGPYGVVEGEQPCMPPARNKVDEERQRTPPEPAADGAAEECEGLGGDTSLAPEGGEENGDSLDVSLGSAAGAQLKWTE
eukprot:Hpha_TRINITY_DN19624_c0_g1::TRINITY_DN19624_c0_g1_i1::g.186192::m.186192